MVKRVLGAAVIVVAVGVALLVRPLRSESVPASAATASAQTPAAAQNPRANINVVGIKPDMITEWEAFQKSDVMPALRKAGVTSRSAYATAIGEAFQYVFITPGANFAARDGAGPIEKALGAEGARAYNLKLRRFLASQHTYVATIRQDLSYMPNANAASPVVIVSDYSIAAGRAADFEAYIKNDLMPAHRQLKTSGFVVHQAIFGGDGNSFIVATLMPSYAQMDKGPAVTQAYGQERARAVQQKLAGIVAHVERTVLRYVPDLSFDTKPATTAR